MGKTQVFIFHGIKYTHRTDSKQELSECQNLVNVIQSSRSRSLSQKLWYGVKDLVTKNTHVKYKSHFSNCSQFMTKVKVFEN